MQEQNSDDESLTVHNVVALFKKLINLRADTDRAGTVELIKSNVDFSSANAWTLVFAIFIASVGLNVNSTAVVIGAMLISPLMGPIVGIGLSLGTYDFILLRRSARNLSIAVLISVITSMIYFLLSPLSEVQSELLSRTRPSFFDVLIAFFGGAAGIVAISRKEKGNNAIPGVAIATALMPPLCTAGFGLAIRNASYFFGAMYLFVINCVFISISTFIFVKYLGFYKERYLDLDQRKKINRWITSVGAAVLIPSFFMAWYLQKESFFRSQANKYINQELRSSKSFIVDRDITYSIKDPKIKVTVLGDEMSNEDLEALKQKAKSYSIPPKAVEINRTSFAEKLEKKIGAKISAAEDYSNQLKIKLTQYEGMDTLSQKVTEEVAVIFPKITLVQLTRSSGNETHCLAKWKSAPSRHEIKKATEFLSKRLSLDRKNITHVREL